MLSLKIGYVLSDLSTAGRGATLVIPGSHVKNRLARPEDPSRGFEQPEGTVEITANPGDAFIFDHRLWHTRSQNTPDVTRKMLFVGYTYRWIRTLDDPSIDENSDWYRSLTPVQRQLMGESKSTLNHWGIDWNGAIDDTIPLRAELKRRGLLDSRTPYLR